MRKNINETKKRCMITAVAGLTLLLVFGGTASGCSGCGDTKVVEDPKIEIEGGDLDFEFDPTKEITITPVPSGGEREEDAPTEVPDEEGNLPLNPGEDEDLTPTPTEEPIPTEIPTLPPTPTPIEEEPTPEPTPIEKDTTPTPTPTPIEKDTTPIPTPVEKDTTPTPEPTQTPQPTKEPEPTKFVEKKNPTLEEDGYTYEDPTDYKVGEVVGSVTPAYSGVPIDVIHHEPGDLFVDAFDGFEKNTTYAYYGDQKHWVLLDDGTYTNGMVFVCYGKLPEELIKKYYSDCWIYYFDEQGIRTAWRYGETKDRYYGKTIADAIFAPIHTVVSEGVPPSGIHHGSFQ